MLRTTDSAVRHICFRQPRETQGCCFRRRRFFGCRFQLTETHNGTEAHTASSRGRAFPLALCVLGAGSLLPACSSSGLGRKGSADGSSQSDMEWAALAATSATGGVTGSGGMPSTGGATSSGGVTPAGGATASSPVDAGFEQAVDAPQRTHRKEGQAEMEESPHRVGPRKPAALPERGAPRHRPRPTPGSTDARRRD